MTSLVERCLAILAIGLLLWTATVAVSSRSGFHTGPRVPIVREEPPRATRHAFSLPLAALDADGDGMPDAVLRGSNVIIPDQPAVWRAAVTTVARRLTGLRLTPLSNPPR